MTVALAHGVRLMQLDDGAFGLWLSRTSGVGMTLFFVLSGFVIHYNYSTSVAAPGAAGKAAFLWTRFARLYPLFAFFLLSDLIGQGGSSLLHGSEEAVQRIHDALPFYVSLTQSWVYVLYGGYDLVHAILPTSELTWSVSTEWFFYLAYIPLVFLFSGLSGLSPRSLRRRCSPWSGSP